MTKLLDRLFLLVFGALTGITFTSIVLQKEDWPAKLILWTTTVAFALFLKLLPKILGTVNSASPDSTKDPKDSN